MIDLHTHSTFSDGSTSPSELVKLAEESGVTVVALTDHNTTAGLNEFLSAAEGTRVRAIAGVEVTSEHKGKELHILALNLPHESFRDLEEFVSRALKKADESKRELTLALTDAGYSVDYDEICSRYPNRVINRSHIASALVEKGYAISVPDAFERLLSEEVGYYKPAKRMESVDVIREIRRLGATPVWAHPLLKLSAEEAEEFLRDLVPAGLAGLEVYYSAYTEEQTEAALLLSEKYGILPSGGSDFHGSIKPGTRLGVGKGNLSIPEKVAEKLLGIKTER